VQDVELGLKDLGETQKTGKAQLFLPQHPDDIHQGDGAGGVARRTDEHAPLRVHVEIPEAQLWMP